MEVSLRQIGAALLDLAFPPACAACREPLASSAEEPFCATCAGAVEPLPPGCARCGLPGFGSGVDWKCGACWADPPAFDAVLAGGLLGGPLADAIHEFKYRDRPALARPLARWLAGRIALAPGFAPRITPGTAPPALVSVPLARRRRLERGYDQAALLGARLSRAAGLPRLTGALRRVRETPPQVGKSRAERARNVAGAFAASPAVRGRRIILVDDVVTTGATAGACARALKDAGAAHVLVVALARAE